MAELVDALVSGTSILLDVQVRVLFWAHFEIHIKTKALKINDLSAFVLGEILKKLHQKSRKKVHKPGMTNSG
jgi:hypothetical protein